MYIVYVLNDRSINVWPIYRLLIQEDNIDTVRFLIPRYYDEHDLFDGDWRMKLLSESNVGEYIGLTAEVFNATHISVDWIPRGAATASSGTLQFELECVLPDYLYQTHVAEILVDSNLDLTGTSEFHPSVLATFLEQVENGVGIANEAAGSALGYSKEAAEYKDLAFEYKESARMYMTGAESAAQGVFDSHFSVVTIEDEEYLKYSY
jgi:hypothetical protein